MQFKEIVCLPLLLNGERGRRSCGAHWHQSEVKRVGRRGWTKGLDYYLAVYISRRNLQLYLIELVTQLVLDGVDEVC